MDEIIVKIEDKEFKLYKLRATASFHLLNNILSLIAKGDDNQLIVQTVHNIMQTGVKVTDDVLADVDILPLIFNAVKSAIASLDEAKQDSLSNQILKSAFFKNGTVEYPVDFEKLDEHFTNVGSIYKLLFECLKLNFSFFLKDKN